MLWPCRAFAAPSRCPRCRAWEQRISWTWWRCTDGTPLLGSVVGRLRLAGDAWIQGPLRGLRWEWWRGAAPRRTQVPEVAPVAQPRRAGAPVAGGGSPLD